MDLRGKIHNRSAIVGVIGLGYVGLPLAVLQAQTGFQVWGIDESEDKVKQVNAGVSYVSDVNQAELQEMVQAEKIWATSDFACLSQCDIVLICVPTPLTPNKEPDISAILKVSQILAGHMGPDKLLILESTTYPGTTDEVILPILSQEKFTVGHDFFLAFSPEREDPGNPKFKTSNTFKLVGGITPQCCDMAQFFYEQSIEKVFPVSSSRVAELTKVFENVFRSVNIALVNELAMLCDRMGINVFEVIEAASTKNFGFMPFYPGPGVGGHCIPLDPYYLAWKAKEYDLHTRFIELAGEINEGMPYFVVNKLQRLLNQAGKCLNGTDLVILGVTYKADIEDHRESPATKVVDLLIKEGAHISYVDPFRGEITIGSHCFQSQSLTPKLLSDSACTIILTAHSNFDYDMIVEHAPLVFDTRNATRNMSDPTGKVFLLST